MPWWWFWNCTIIGCPKEVKVYKHYRCIANWACLIDTTWDPEVWIFCSGLCRIFLYSEISRRTNLRVILHSVFRISVFCPKQGSGVEFCVMLALFSISDFRFGGEQCSTCLWKVTPRPQVNLQVNSSICLGRMNEQLLEKVPFWVHLVTNLSISESAKAVTVHSLPERHCEWKGCTPLPHLPWSTS